MEPVPGVEPRSEAYKATVLATELYRQIWSDMSGSNRPPSDWKSDVLPDELMSHYVVETVGIEPTTFWLQTRCSPR